ncbi:MAG: hypothetical protein DI536_27510 [Archangium gephyra]|uniref:DUF2330 domain-containing protein n=1 Tax=Archangium gephyra TaxID=48 RepID=A0A2W5UVN5_9BACT|nr:MAG: hypothetical protein DI536_27510 [Archangium gephyra]
MKLLLVVVALLSTAAHAFCGFYVSSAGAEMFNDASMVVLMRDGTRTVLSMQNNYRGPPSDFALVIPVPVILKKENVKTLARDVFTRIDTIASPRLVEDFEQGACPPMAVPAPVQHSARGGGRNLPKDLGVKVEAKFEVGEYEIVVLSAKDALGLDIWLKENKYKIPANAEPLLQPYVQNGWKFFVARVNVKKVTFVDGQAVLSPLRFFYDAEKFELPVRLGLVNSSGTQDLIVHIIGKTRFEVANRKNVLVPTNVQLTTEAEPVFGGFYAALLARTFDKNAGAAVTEFAWEGALPPPKVEVGGGIYGVTCDPCPPPSPVDDALTRTLGADSIPGLKTDEDIAKFAKRATLTRLHLRYTKDSLTDDLVFAAADPVAGGVPEVAKAGPAKTNRFQGRYIVKKPFDVTMCYRGFGASQGAYTPASSGLAGTGGVQAKATKLPAAFETYLRSDIAELGVQAAKVTKPK